MMGSLKVAKGRIEEAVGALVGSDKLRAKGRKDQRIGLAGQTGEKLVDTVRDKVGKTVEVAKEKARDAKKNLTTTGGIAKGRVEEAAGVLVGNEKLRAKGLKDQAVGRVRKDADVLVQVAKASARKQVAAAKTIAKVAVKKAEK